MIKRHRAGSRFHGAQVSFSVGVERISCCIRRASAIDVVSRGVVRRPSRPPLAAGQNGPPARRRRLSAQELARSRATSEQAVASRRDGGPADLTRAANAPSTTPRERPRLCWRASEAAHFRWFSDSEVADDRMRCISNHPPASSVRQRAPLPASGVGAPQTFPGPQPRRHNRRGEDPLRRSAPAPGYGPPPAQPRPVGEHRPVRRRAHTARPRVHRRRDMGRPRVHRRRDMVHRRRDSARHRLDRRVGDRRRVERHRRAVASRRPANDIAWDRLKGSIPSVQR